MNLKRSAGSEYFAEDHPREILVGGRGAAKDFDMILKKLSRGFMYYPVQLRHRIRAGIVYHLVMFAHTEENFVDNLAKLTDFIPKIPGKAVDGTNNYRYDVEKQQFHLFGKDQLVVSCVSLYKATAARSKGCDDAILTEAQLMKEKDVENEIFGVVFRPTYPGRLGMTANPDEGGWVDQACEQAKTGNGYYGNFRLYERTMYDNPHCTQDMLEQALRLRDKNPWRYRVQVLGERNVIVPEDAAPNCAITTGLLEGCYTEEYEPAPLNPIIYYDLAWTGADKMAEMFTDPQRSFIFELNFYDKTTTIADPSKPNVTPIVKIMEAAYRRFPGAKIYYDATGPLGRNVWPHIPPYMRHRVTAVNRAGGVKNQHVGACLLRMVPDETTGKAVGLRLPDPKKYRFGSTQQKQNFIELYGQMLHYREIQTVTKTGQPAVYYTKGEGWGDDGMDALTGTCFYLPPMQKPYVRKRLSESRLGMYG